MPSDSYATPAGTTQYSKRFSSTLPSGHFRPLQGLTVSSIGLGTYLGDHDDATDRQYQEAIVRAVELGSNIIDSAINYRFQRSERAVGAALRRLFSSGQMSRDQAIITTKGGFIPFDTDPPRDPAAYFVETFVKPGIVRQDEMVAGCHCMTPRYIDHQLKTSLKNMGLSCIDVYYLHNPETQLQEISRAEFLHRIRAAFEVLEGAVSQGLIRLYGTATWNGYRASPRGRDYLSLSELLRVAEEVAGKDHHFRVVQLPYNLVMPEAFTIQNQPIDGRMASFLDAVSHFGISVMSSASISQGQLSSRLPDFIGECLEGLASDAQRAIQFVRSTPGVSVALVGMRQKAHVEENLATAKTPPASLEQLRKLFNHGSKE